MLKEIPAWHVPQEWATIGPALAKAIERDPQRDIWTVLDQAMSADLDFWRVTDEADGYIVTQVEGKTFWIIYAAGRGLHSGKADVMQRLEDEARKVRCSEIKFEGRDWRRIYPDYSASRSEDGRWHFRKALT